MADLVAVRQGSAWRYSANRHSGLLVKHTESVICHRKITRHKFDDLAVVNDRPLVDIASSCLNHTKLTDAGFARQHDGLAFAALCQAPALEQQMPLRLAANERRHNEDDSEIALEATTMLTRRSLVKATVGLPLAAHPCRCRSGPRCRCKPDSGLYDDTRRAANAFGNVGYRGRAGNHFSKARAKAKAFTIVTIDSTQSMITKRIDLRSSFSLKH